MREVWKVWRWPYLVSDSGRVMNFNTLRCLSGTLSRKGYRSVCLSFGHRGTTETVLIHRMVARCFLGPCPDRKQVNHKDGCKPNNAASNMEYVSLIENIQHAVKHGLTASGDRQRLRRHPEAIIWGEKVHCAKLTIGKVREIRKSYASSAVSQRGLAARYGVSCNTIKEVLKGRAWRSS